MKKISGKSKSQKERDAEAMAKKVEKEEAKGGRIKWKDDETKKRNTKIINEEKERPIIRRPLLYIFQPFLLQDQGSVDIEQS